MTAASWRVAIATRHEEDLVAFDRDRDRLERLGRRSGHDAAAGRVEMAVVARADDVRDGRVELDDAAEVRADRRERRDSRLRRSTTTTGLLPMATTLPVPAGRSASLGRQARDPAGAAPTFLGGIRKPTIGVTIIEIVETTEKLSRSFMNRRRPIVSVRRIDWRLAPSVLSVRPGARLVANVACDAQ